ncbi:ABC transporter permease subunit [Candidatus Sumerlaeota bacterium]|nr:ABC transporter permease subunit [Candidatus Sumerlaeota bacterium]
MGRYLVKRLLLLIITLIGITAITFLLTRLTPGDPAAMKLQGGAGGLSQAVGGYDELVERNRRNLGLDKPLLLNWHFEDREFEANRALDDYLRRGEYWRRDGEKRLIRMTTIALKPALDRYAIIGTKDTRVMRDSEGKPREMEDPDTQRMLLSAIFARLAVESGSTEKSYDYWSEWYERNRSRYEAANVRTVVESYLAAPDDATAATLQGDVLKTGGFAVPLLMKGIDSRNERRAFLANRALQAQVGFTFLVEEKNFATTRDEIVRRWKSWWRRESIAYSTFSPWGHAWNVMANTQYGLWTRQALTFDFGDSYMKHRAVLSMMGEALPISVLISGLSILISYLVAIPLGIVSAAKKNTPTDKVITLALFILYSLPSFWVAGILIMTMTGPPYLNWFPSRGLASSGSDQLSSSAWLWDRAWHLVLPVTVLTYGSLAFISRQMRSAMLETLSLDYIRTAQAKGAAWRSVMFKHALRNSLIPVITISAGILPELIAGAIITESIFTIPGMGILTLDAIVNRDYPVINAVLFFSALLTLLGILISDLCYALADPRITFD